VPSTSAGLATMLDPARSIALAERVADVARELGFESALIGAGALAVHRYTRGTEDIDLAVFVDPGPHLTDLAQRLRDSGLRATLRLPDDEDPLGGVISVHPAREDQDLQDDLVEVVNFRNPANPVRNPGPGALARARPLPDSTLRCVTVEDLVALKLYAGGLADHADIVELLARNPDVDAGQVRAIASPFDTTGVLEGLMKQAAQRGSTPR
jgi:hypothetical protein